MMTDGQKTADAVYVIHLRLPETAADTDTKLSLGLSPRRGDGFQTATDGFKWNS